MSDLERAAAACLLPPFPGTEPPEWLRRWIERGLGGVVLFAQNVGDDVGALTARLRAERPGLLVATDEEGGDVTRLEWRRGSSYPGNLALGAVDDVHLTERVAAALGSDLARAGVNLDFAPVADVNTNPRNPVIGVRSFGSEPGLVARHVAAFVRGVQRTGVAACAKHFPGHGDTEVDSHLELPVAGGDLDAALEPFRAAIAAGVRAVMTAHIVVPELDSAPATLSRRTLHGLLREELGFDGLVVTDALEMRAVADGVGIEEGAVRSLAAGADALCLGAATGEDVLARTHAAIVAAVRDGRLAEERLLDAAARVERLAAEALPAPADADPAVGAEAARRALVVESRAELVRPPYVVELRPEPLVAAGEASHSLADALGAEATILREPRPLELDPERQLVLVVRDAARRPWIAETARRLVEAAPDAIVVDTGLPGAPPRGAAGYVATLGGGRVNFEAAAEALRGAGVRVGAAGAGQTAE